MKPFPLVSLFVLVLTACTSTPSATPTPTATPTPAPTLPRMSSECFLHRLAYVWIDRDGDGIVGAAEAPLSGVLVTIYPSGQPDRAFSAQTSPNGTADINGIGDFGRFCDELEAEVTVPAGYTPSTPARFSLLGLPPAETLQFGLLPPESTPISLNVREIPLLYPSMDPLPIDYCPFASIEQLEVAFGALYEPVDTLVIVLPPNYEERASVRCTLRFGPAYSHYLDVWFAPDRSAARLDYDEIAALTSGETVQVNGLGDAAFWWPLGVRLEATSGDTRITVSFAWPLPDAASRAAELAANTLETIDPAAGAVEAEAINIPPELAALDVATIPYPSNGGTFFEACSLITREEFEAASGPLDFPPQTGASFGELEGQFYECSTDPGETVAWLYYNLHFSGTPGDAILNYRRDAVNRPASATRLENLGDEAWFWISEDGAILYVSAVRGNVTLQIQAILENRPENRARLESLAQLILERLFEPE